MHLFGLKYLALNKLGQLLFSSFLSISSYGVQIHFHGLHLDARTLKCF